MKLFKTAAALFITLALVLLLVYDKPLMFPFLFALLLWFFVSEVKFLFDRIRFVRNRIPG